MAVWPAIEIVFPGPGATAPDAPSVQDRVLADLDGLDMVAIGEHASDVWRVFFRTEADRAAAMALLHAMPAPAAIDVRPVDVDDEDWARRSQASLRAVRAGRVAVAPPWDALARAPEPDVLTVVIEPAMGFGSGHHATTRLCLEALQRCDLAGRRVLDIGTGSGVLALAAVRLGASSVLGVDVDPDALDNARGNAVLNGSPPNVEFRLADFRHDPALVGDVVVANLTGGMLAAGSDALVRSVARGGHLIISGLTAEEREQVYRAFTAGLSMEWQAEEAGWCCALLQRNAASEPVASSQ